MTESSVTLDTEVIIDSDTYSTSSGVITVKETGTYLIINHAAIDRGGGSNRTSGETFLHINNTLVSGNYTDGYIRRNGGCEETSACAYGIHELTANDTVELRKLRINQAGSDGRILGNVTTYLDANTSLSLIRLDENEVTCILEGAAGDTSSLTTTDSFLDQTWTTQTRLDAGYTHTSGSANITIDSPGKYLVCYSNSWERATDSGTRTGVYERLELDSSDVAGSYSNNYIRGTQSGEQIFSRRVYSYIG